MPFSARWAQAYSRQFGDIAISMVVALVWSVAAQAQTIAFTFDDGFQVDHAGEQAIVDNQRILATLQRHGVKSILFPTGTALSHPENMKLVQAWGQAGHAVGNHAFSHHALSQSKTESYLRDIQKAHTLLQKTPGRCLRFRFPYLDEGTPPMQHNQVMHWLAQNGYGVASTTITLADWEFDARYQAMLSTGTPSQIKQFQQAYVEEILQEMQTQQKHWHGVLGRDPAHVILLHTNPLNAKILDHLLIRTQQLGWDIVTPSRAFSDPIYQRSYRQAGAPETTPGIALPNPVCH